MQGNLHVRFGERDEETCPGNGARRFIPTPRVRASPPARSSGMAHRATVLARPAPDPSPDDRPSPMRSLPTCVTPRKARP